jgi:signal transduction histidine kinase
MAGVIGLLIAADGGNWLSHRALTPVDALTHTARTINVNNLGRRLETPGTGDELQRLSETLNEMLARIESSVQRITEFTADASHELRAPVALIRAEPVPAHKLAAVEQLARGAQLARPGDTRTNTSASGEIEVRSTSVQ